MGVKPGQSGPFYLWPVKNRSGRTELLQQNGLNIVTRCEVDWRTTFFFNFL